MGASNRLQIVTRALALSGRGVEIRQVAEDFLNDILRSWAIEHRYPLLKKVGDQQTLLSGSTTLTLPADFGADLDNLLLGEDKVVIKVVDLDDFVHMGGFPKVNSSSGQPTFSTIDREANALRFNVAANKNYAIFPIYYKIPTPLTSDTEVPWYPNDDTLVQGLLERLYQYLGDEREVVQAQRVSAMRGNDRRGLFAITSGGKTVTLGRSTFRNVGRGINRRTKSFF